MRRQIKYVELNEVEKKKKNEKPLCPNKSMGNRKQFNMKSTTVN